MPEMPSKHSVLLKEEECEGCTNCVKNCPTKAIRVHQGKATIKEELCIDCAECIRTCEYHAKYTQTDELDILENYSHPVALIPPSFYGQFDKKIRPEQIVSSLHSLGFKEIRNIATAAEAVTKKTAQYLSENKGLFISSSCPVIVRLIKISYPELLEYLLPFKSPVEIMAQKVKNDLQNEKKAGIFFITPCPAKLTTVETPLGQKNSYLDGAFAVDKVYEKLLQNIRSGDNNYSDQKNYSFPYSGIGWGQSGGEVSVLKEKQKFNTLSVEGISSVKSVLDEIVRNNVKGIKYLEMTACPRGCVGGVLNVKNPFQAQHNIKQLVKNHAKNEKVRDLSQFSFNLDFDFKAEEVGKLDEDLNKAMEKFAQLEQEEEILPGLDCASCGAPDCETLAEDIVNNKAQRTDCIFMLRKEIKELATRISNLTHELPPVMSRNGRDNNES